jgi:hypothetical protein
MAACHVWPEDDAGSFMALLDKWKHPLLQTFIQLSFSLHGALRDIGIGDITFLVQALPHQVFFCIFLLGLKAKFVRNSGFRLSVKVHHSR